jgi:hypothetical protein
MLAPVYRASRNFICKSIELSLGCRLGWSALNAQIETAIPSALQGTKKQQSNIFACEPFLRLEVPLASWLRLGFDSGYACRNFWQVFNSDGTGLYANGTLTEKNPDGTDTAVDLSGWTDRGYLALVF